MIIDTDIFELGRRIEMYTEINNKFGFLSNLENQTLNNVLIKDENIFELYNLDIHFVVQFKNIQNFPS